MANTKTNSQLKGVKYHSLFTAADGEYFLAAVYELSNGAGMALIRMDHMLSVGVYVDTLASPVKLFPAADLAANLREMIKAKELDQADNIYGLNYAVLAERGSADNNFEDTLVRLVESDFLDPDDLEGINEAIDSVESAYFELTPME